MIPLKSVLSHSQSVVTRKTGDEYILIPVSNDIADMDSIYTLNETGAFIWEHIDGKRSLDEIIDLLTEEYAIDKETATTDLLSFIDKTKEFLVVQE
jgi:hypothetical protein